MFGLSSIELLFVAVLALVFIGPRDLPQVLRGAGSIFVRLRRVYQDVRGSVTQLEREIDLVDNPRPDRPGWLEFLPDEVRELRESIVPHGDPEETRARYQAYKQAVAKAQQDYRASQPDEAVESSDATDADAVSDSRAQADA